jgi:prepilin-type N-terminal cleavage/methylation domain-containing protein
MIARHHKLLKGFSLIELLVVMAIVAALLAILYPSLSRARLQAKILVVNQELNQVGLALEAYEFSNNSGTVGLYGTGAYVFTAAGAC